MFVKQGQLHVLKSHPTVTKLHAFKALQKQWDSVLVSGCLRMTSLPVCYLGLLQPDVPSLFEETEQMPLLCSSALPCPLLLSP